MNCDFVKWDKNRQEAELSHFDIGLMPLDNTPWTKGKCSYKLLQYLSCGIPFVASAVGRNIDVMKTSGAGFIVNNSDEFEEKLLYLLKNRTIRSRMGKSGFEAANKYYSVKVVARRLAMVLIDLIAGDK